jgi:hypothetical protein
LGSEQIGIGEEGGVEERDVLWQQFSEVDENGPTALENMSPLIEDGMKTTMHTSSEWSYRDELSPALLINDADLVARCLLTAIRINDLDFVRNIPKTTFSEIIRTLDTSRFVAKLGNVHLEIGTACASAMNIAPMREVAFEYASVLRQVLAIRRAAGVHGTLADSRALLRCARDLGNLKMADLVWSDLMSQGHTPDVRCYNFYMSATVWNGMHLAGFRQKVRVIPFTTMKRKNEGYKERKFADYSIGEGGVLESTMRIFNDMVAQSVAADEESFRILIVAAAREGDLQTVKSILQRVWSIDVDGVLGNGNTPPILPKTIPEHSPLYPRTNLLFTIAHAFGINNDVPAAIRLVDFVSRHYNMNITEDVWGQLFEWTFVLSVRRHGTSNRDGSREGQISADSVQKLWQTMVGEPYNITPTMGMYNYMIKSLAQREKSGDIADILRGDARQLFRQQRQRSILLFESIKQKLRSGNLTSSQRKGLEYQRKKWELQDLIGKRNSFWVRRWLRLLLGSFRNSHRDSVIAKNLTEVLPQLLWAWRHLAPTDVRYETPTGMVQLEFRTKQQLVDTGLAMYALKVRRNEAMNPTARFVGDDWVRRRPRLSRRLAEAAGIPYDPQTHGDVRNQRTRRRTDSGSFAVT